MSIDAIRKQLSDLQNLAFGSAGVPTEIPRNSCDPNLPLESQPISCLVELGKQKSMDTDGILFPLTYQLYEDFVNYDEEFNFDPIGVYPGSGMQRDAETENIIDKFKREYPAQNKRWTETVPALVREQLKPYKSLAESLLK